jgi:hypothetical protein
VSRLGGVPHLPDETVPIHAFQQPELLSAAIAQGNPTNGARHQAFRQPDRGTGLSTAASALQLPCLSVKEEVF